MLCRLPHKDTNPHAGAFVGIFGREGGSFQQRQQAMESLTQKCRLIIQHLAGCSSDGGSCLRQCCRIDFGLNGVETDLAWGITGVTWGCGMDLYSSVDSANAVVFIDTVLEGLAADGNA